MLVWITASFIALYGLLNAFAGLSQLRTRQIPSWSASGMLLAGLMLLATSILLLFSTTGSVWLFFILLLASLLAIHILTLYNGFYLHGRVKPAHHLLRLAISLTLLLLAYFARLSVSPP
jgi:hypothetical protein